MIVTIFFTSAFWLTIEFILLSYTNRLNVEFSQAKNQLPQARKPVLASETSYELSIEDFRSFYVTKIPPIPAGPGEKGVAVYNDKNDPAEVSKEKEGYKKYSFNEVASAKISLERAIPDNRPSE